MGRLVRVLFAATTAMGVYLFFTLLLPNVWSRPIGSFTLRDLILGLCIGVFPMFVLYGAWRLALWEDPEPSREAELRSRARKSVRIRRETGEEQRAADPAKSKVARRYKTSWLWGLLNDPNMGLEKHPVLRTFVIVGLVALIYLALILWVAHTRG
jgi:hypothetical protein